MKSRESAKKTLEVGKMSRAAKTVVLIAAVLGALLVWIYAMGFDNTLFERTFNGITVVLEGESKLDGDALIAAALENTEVFEL